MGIAGLDLACLAEALGDRGVGGCRAEVCGLTLGEALHCRTSNCPFLVESGGGLAGRWEMDEEARHGKERGMKKTAIVASAVLMLMGFGVAGADESQAAGGQAAAAQAVKKQTVCPVEGGQVKTNLFVDFKGQRIYFCCDGCPAEFKKDPAKFMAKLAKDGVTLDKAPAGDPIKTQTQDAAADPAKGCDGSCAKGENCCR